MIDGIRYMWEDELDEIIELYGNELSEYEEEDLWSRIRELEDFREKLKRRQTEMLKTMKAAADAMSDYFILIEDYGAFTKVKDLDDVLKEAETQLSLAEEYCGFIRDDIALLRTEKAKEAA